jgi:hypothetical protein
MPAQAGIRDKSAGSSRDASWIPGLALLARNDEPAMSLSFLLWQSTARSAANETHHRREP